MIKFILVFLTGIFLLSPYVWSGPGPNSNIVQYSNNGVPTNVSNSNPLPVNVNAGLGVTANQGTPGPLNQPWPVEPTDGTNHASYTAGNAENINITNDTLTCSQTTASNLNATVVGPGGVSLAKDSSLATINTTLGTPMQQTGGSVTANAGTNLNTSALALETGGNLATVANAQGAAGTGITQPAGGSGLLGWLSGIYKAVTNSLAVTVGNWPATQAVTQSGTWSGVGVTGTFWQATQPVSGTFWQSTQPVSAASLPLPSGAATSTLQSTISGQLPASLGAKTTANSMAVTIASDQTVAIAAPVNANGSLSARQTVTTTESYVVAPAHAVGVIVECESVNSDNLRWGFSNSATAILSTTIGVLCEPGRDTGELHFGTGTYVHLIATGSINSDYADVQWELSQ